MMQKPQMRTIHEQLATIEKAVAIDMENAEA
jgi:hypothetical protein